MYRYILIILLSSLSLTSFSQKKDIDKILHKLETHPAKDTAYVDILFGAALYYLNTDLQQLRVYADSMISVSEAIGYDKGKAAGLNLKGGSMWLNNELDEALMYFKQSLKMYEELNIIDRILLIQNNIGLVYSSKNEYYNAYQIHKNIHDKAVELDDEYMTLLSYLNMANDLLKNERYASAVGYGEQLMEGVKHYKTTKPDAAVILESSGIIDLMKSYVALDANDKASRWADHIEAISDFSDLPIQSIAEYKLSLGYYYDQIQNYQKAKEETQTALDVLPVGQYLTIRDEGRILLAKVDYALGQINKVITQGEQAFDGMETTHNFDQRRQLHHILASAYAQKGLYSKALEHSKAYKLYNDSINTIINSNRLTEADYQASIQEQVLENETLLAQKVATQVKLKNRNKGLLAILLGLLLFGALLYYFRNRGRLKEVDIARLENKVDEYTAHLVHINEDLKDKNAELERFAYIASHDLKEPLRNINSFTGLVEHSNKGVFDKETKSYFSYVQSNAQQMKLLIDDILEYTRLSQLDINMEKVNLQKVVSHIVDELGDESIKVKADLPKIHTDRKVVTTILSQLIANGIKFNDSKKPKIEVSYANDPVYHILNISDNGIGIPVEFQNKIFDMFSRLHTRDKYIGTGVGLAKCKKILNMIGGDIAVRSIDGQGTRFTVSIPRELEVSTDLAKTG